ncbi:hypothetical protein ACWG0P_03970 [Amedibacillus sp. YH-ame6]
MREQLTFFLHKFFLFALNMLLVVVISLLLSKNDEVWQQVRIIIGVCLLLDMIITFIYTLLHYRNKKISK